MKNDKAPFKVPPSYDMPSSGQKIVFFGPKWSGHCSLQKYKLQAVINILLDKNSVRCASKCLFCSSFWNNRKVAIQVNCFENSRSLQPFIEAIVSTWKINHGNYHDVIIFVTKSSQTWFKVFWLKCWTKNYT